MSLEKYRKKRNFNKTSEPKGKRSSQTTKLFVVQKHAASHLHYDFRLELNGVLKSWAVPKGPTLDPSIKRLAIAVEDHPVAYGSFEGTIPKGQYGAGTVEIWDRGTWEPLDPNPMQAYRAGHLRFILHAKKLNGRWDLIRFKEADNQWFLVKYQDSYAKSIDPADKPREVAFAGEVAFPGFIAPQLLTLVKKPPPGKSWLHEVKFDGYRILALIEDQNITLISRNAKDWTHFFPNIITALKKFKSKNTIFDGEIVVLDQAGKSNFQLLQNSITSKDTNFIYYIFDILYYDKHDLRKLPLEERKTILEDILQRHPTQDIRYSEHIIGSGEEIFKNACEMSLEGIVSKRLDATYISKRSKSWVKTKCLREQEFVIGGYTKPKGSRKYFGSLFLGVFNKKGELDFTGNVGTGFTEKSLQEIYKLLQPYEQAENPFNAKPPGAKHATWVKPVLVAVIEFTEWTEDNRLRHPVFKKLSTSFKITSPNKKLYPEDGITKADLLHYYDAISAYILPFVVNRPLTLLRCPENYTKCFYQRHFNKTTDFIVLSDKHDLLNLVQMSVLELHPWASQINNIERPDWITFDLDPGPNVSWKKVVLAALEIKEHLTQYNLTSFVKTTGGKGLHVVVPIQAKYDWEDIKIFSQAFVEFLEQLKPKSYISNMSKAKRTGKIFIDYLRNQRTASAISVYSTRAKLHAPISTPLHWEELSFKKRDNEFTLTTILQRLDTLKTDPWETFLTMRQSLPLK